MRSTLLVAAYFSYLFANAQFSPPKVITKESLIGTVCMTQGDFDGDGDIDLVAAGYPYGVMLFLNMDGTDDFEPVRITEEWMLPTAVHMVDVDVDGLMDVVVDGDIISWFKNLGGNSFGPSTPFPNTEANHQMIQFDDADGDGDQDAFMLLAPGQLLRMDNLGGGQFSPAVQLGSINYNADMVLMDLDGDGDKDIVAAYGAQCLIYRHEADDTYLQQTSLNMPVCGPQHPTWIFAMDLDNDGNMDIVDHANCPGGVEWRRSLGQEVLQRPRC
jgi:hypothetical protein